MARFTLISVFFFCSIFTIFCQTNINHTLLHDGRSRLYTVHLPPELNDDSSYPIVIFLHGGGGNIQSAQGFTLFNTVSNESNFLVAYPQGFGTLDGLSFTWADGRGTSADQQGVDDVSFINVLIDSLIVQYPVDYERVYLCGFSNGGFLTQRIACEANTKLAAIGLIGSSMGVDLTETCQPGRTIPTLIMTGTTDPLVPYEGGPMNGNAPDIISSEELIDFWAQTNNCQTQEDSSFIPDRDQTDNSTVVTIAQTDCDCDADVLHYQIKGGGHTWPGVELPSYEPIGGETNEDILASEELWKFFRKHTFCESLSTNLIDKKEKLTFKTYPNPTSRLIQLEANEPIHSIALQNILGEFVHLKKPKTLGKKFTLELPELKTGLYFLQLTMKNGVTLSERIFIR